MWDFLLIAGLFYFLFNLAAMPRLVFETMNRTGQPNNRRLLVSCGIFAAFAMPYLLFPLVPFVWAPCSACSNADASKLLDCGVIQLAWCLEYWFAAFSLMFGLVYAVTGAAAITAAIWGGMKQG